jgi:enoyl-CoA hydratase/carnithine racemase
MPQKNIRDAFQWRTLEGIMNALSQHSDDWHQETLAQLHQKSPLSLKVTFQQLIKAGSKSLKECLKMDYDLANHFMQGHDFYEGVRALLVDKDKSPHWSPSTLEGISDEEVRMYFNAVKDDPNKNFI